MSSSFSKEDAKKLGDKTDYDRLKEMTEEEIENIANEEGDSKAPSDEELKKFRKVSKNEN